MTTIERGPFRKVKLCMLKISVTRRPGCLVPWLGKQVQCQLEFSWIMGQSSDDIKTMLESVERTS